MRRAVLLPLLLAFAAGAADVCAPGDALDKYQYLRRLSLDLRGRVPTVEEYEALDTVGDVPRLLIQTWLATDDFRLAMRRYHKAMLWPNLSNLRINDQGANLGAAATAAGEPIYYTPGFRAAIRRGGDVPCGDFEQTHFDPAHPGEPRPAPAFVRTVDVNGVTVRQEGYRTISPYWDPTTKAKACAYDLQETAQALHPNGRTVSCSSREADALPECGCGRGLRYCYGPGPAVIPPVLASFREQLGRHVDDVSVGGRPYTDLVLSTDAWENGPLGFWKKNLSPHYSLPSLFAMPAAAPLRHALSGRGIARARLHRRDVREGPSHAAPRRSAHASRISPALPDRPRAREPVPDQLPLQLFRASRAPGDELLGPVLGHGRRHHAAVQLPLLPFGAGAARFPLGSLRHRRNDADDGPRPLPQVESR